MHDQRSYRKTMMKKPGEKCLILAEDSYTGNQVTSLLEESGWQMYVVHSDKDAYARLQQEHMHVVIADIDAVDLGGLALLACCYHQNPSITTYAIAPVDDGYRKMLARDLGGCRGFFYLVKGSRNIDSSRGMAANLPGYSLSPASLVACPE